MATITPTGASFYRPISERPLTGIFDVSVALQTNSSVNYVSQPGNPIYANYAPLDQYNTSGVVVADTAGTLTEVKNNAGRDIDMRIIIDGNIIFEGNTTSGQTIIGASGLIAESLLFDAGCEVTTKASSNGSTALTAKWVTYESY